MSYKSLLIHKCYRQNTYSSQNNFGEWTFNYSSQLSRPITCRISPWTITEELILNRGEEVIRPGIYDGVKFKCFVSGTLPVSSLKIGDRMCFSANSVHDWETYRVKDYVRDSTGFHKSALLEEL